MKIPLRKRGGEIVAFANVDPDLYESLNNRCWHLYRGYAARTLPSGSKVLMHREIVGANPRDGSEIHHENENRLDNRKANLVITTKARHRHLHAGHGVSGFRGVRPSRSGQRWRGRVKAKGVEIQLGTFNTAEEASEAVETWWAAREASERQRPASYAGR
jgi:hypothetical protein